MFHINYQIYYHHAHKLCDRFKLKSHKNAVKHLTVCVRCTQMTKAKLWDLI